MSDTNSAPAVLAAIDPSDILKGHYRIAAFIGEKPRRTYTLCAKGLIPVGRLGHGFVASKAVLAEHYRRLVSGQL